MGNSDKDFKYKIKKNTVCISKYIGKKNKVLIPEFIENYPVTKIGKCAFENCNLVEINIPKTVTEIDYGAFKNNNLTNVEFSNSVNKIGPAAFKENKLEKLIVPESLLIIEYWAFADNMLTELQFHSNIQEIQSVAFENNELYDVSIPDSLKRIGKSAFAGNKIKEILLSKSVIETGKTVLKDITSHVKLFEYQDRDILTSRFITFEGEVNDIRKGKTKKGLDFEAVNFTENECVLGLIFTNENYDKFNNIVEIGKHYVVNAEIIEEAWCLGGYRTFKINSIKEI